MRLGILLVLLCATPRLAVTQEYDTVAVIGGRDAVLGDGEEHLLDVRSVQINPDGGVVVAHDGLVSAYDAEGRFRRHLATDGEGPGEVRVPMALALLSGDDLGDLAVFDPMLDRVTTIDASGAVSETVRIPMGFDGAAARSFALLDDRTVVATASRGRRGLYAAILAGERGPRPREGTSVIEDTVDVLWFSDQGMEVRHSIPVGSRVTTRNGIVQHTFVPPAGTSIMLAAGGGRLAVVSSTSPDVVLFAETDGPFRIVDTGVVPLPMDASKGRVLRSRFLADSASPRIGGMDTGRAAAKRAAAEAVDAPPVAPLWDRAILSDGGVLFLREVSYATDAFRGEQVWRSVDLLDETSTSGLAIPGDLEVMDVEGRLVATLRVDELGVESIVLLRSIP